MHLVIAITRKFVASAWRGFGSCGVTKTVLYAGMNVLQYSSPGILTTIIPGEFQKTSGRRSRWASLRLWEVPAA